ncbi:hypothetical protein PIB30_073916 [Stylosanthes scabra]|uniref:Uncharacterized protein n=1 Tax=Stylosanthes scabra TaxID=79078 RepID=A0ABU6VPS1_9FABA|nr:hypothetical protein [Stylosanthes scabra]
MSPKFFEVWKDDRCSVTEGTSSPSLRQWRKNAIVRGTLNRRRPKKEAARVDLRPRRSAEVQATCGRLAETLKGVDESAPVMAGRRFCKMEQRHRSLASCVPTSWKKMDGRRDARAFAIRVEPGGLGPGRMFGSGRSSQPRPMN